MHETLRVMIDDEDEFFTFNTLLEMLIPDVVRDMLKEIYFQYSIRDAVGGMPSLNIETGENFQYSIRDAIRRYKAAAEHFLMFFQYSIRDAYLDFP